MVYISFKSISSSNHNNIVFHKSKFTQHPFLQITDDTRIYYYVQDQWISFAVLEFSEACGSEDYWANPESELVVDATFFGEIAHDGIRHAYMPYWFCLNEFTLIKILQDLNTLARKYIDNYEPA